MPIAYLKASSSTSDAPTRPFSSAVRAGEFIYVSGQVGKDAKGQIASGGIEAQTRQAFENIKAVLALDGATLDDVCKCTCWLDDARDFREFNRIYMTYCSNGYPARSAVEARLIIDAKIENRGRCL